MAALWSDFVYDDHGATGLIVAPGMSNLAPTIGTYVYPDGPASNNGADIFRAAVGLDSRNSYWRVDWTTLVNPRIPIAEWVFGHGEPSREWPGGAGVRSADVAGSLLVSSRGAWLVDPRTGHRLDVVRGGGALHVDLLARSFVVRVPRSLLQVSGTWRLRLASGLADPSGRSFTPVPLPRGLCPGNRPCTTWPFGRWPRSRPAPETAWPRTFVGSAAPPWWIRTSGTSPARRPR